MKLAEEFVLHFQNIGINNETFIPLDDQLAIGVELFMVTEFNSEITIHTGLIWNCPIDIESARLTT